MDNKACTILFNCMQVTVWQTKYNNVRLVKIKEVWDFKNNDFVNNHGQFTAFGVATYWAAVDAAVAFNVQKCDEFLSRRGLYKDKKFVKVAQTPSTQDQKKFKEQDMVRFFQRSKNWKRQATDDVTSYPWKLPSPTAVFTLQM